MCRLCSLQVVGALKRKKTSWGLLKQILDSLVDSAVVIFWVFSIASPDRYFCIDIVVMQTKIKVMCFDLCIDCVSEAGSK